MAQDEDFELLIAGLCNGTLDAGQARSLLEAAQNSPALRARIEDEIELASRIRAHFLRDQDDDRPPE